MCHKQRSAVRTAYDRETRARMQRQTRDPTAAHPLWKKDSPPIAYNPQEMGAMLLSFYRFLQILQIPTDSSPHCITM